MCWTMTFQLASSISSLGISLTLRLMPSRKVSIPLFLRLRDKFYNYSLTTMALALNKPQFKETKTKGFSVVELCIFLLFNY